MSEAEKLQAIANHLRDPKYCLVNYRVFGLNPWYAAQRPKKALREAMASYLDGLVQRFGHQSIEILGSEDASIDQALAEKSYELDGGMSVVLGIGNE